jgi:hypothetical protein
MNEIEQIRDRLLGYCKFTPSTCYLLVLLARKKENPDLTEKHKLEKCNRFVLHSSDDIDHALEEIQSRAALYPDLKFRVYVSVNRRCLNKAMYSVTMRLARLSVDLINGNLQAYTTISRLGSEFKSLLAEKECRAERRLLFDIDFDNRTVEGSAAYDEFIARFYKCPTLKTVHLHWRTLNGFAAVTDPFDMQELGALPKEVTMKPDDYLYLGILNNGG